MMGTTPKNGETPLDARPSFDRARTGSSQPQQPQPQQPQPQQPQQHPQQMSQIKEDLLRRQQQQAQGRDL